MRLFHSLFGYFVKKSPVQIFFFSVTVIWFVLIPWDEGTIGSHQNGIVLMRIPGEMTATVATVAFWWHGSGRRVDLVLAAVGA